MYFVFVRVEFQSFAYVGFGVAAVGLGEYRGFAAVQRYGALQRFVDQGCDHVGDLGLFEYADGDGAVVRTDEPRLGDRRRSGQRDDYGFLQRI